jgi:hypothetical protein
MAGQAPVLRRRSPTLNAARATLALMLALFCAGCGGGSRATSGWDGRRGYDGNGDYGYDLAAARSEARSYRARAARAYPVPGTPDDPWGPYIREAAARFQIPERWIRAVMRQESGGHQYGADGTAITSGAGAMGLMQVMPRTYDTLTPTTRTTTSWRAPPISATCTRSTDRPASSPPTMPAPTGSPATSRAAPRYRTRR